MFEKLTCIEAIKPIFLTPSARKVFNYLKQAFIQALILQHFDLKNHIWIEIDNLDYAIDGVFKSTDFGSGNF